MSSFFNNEKKPFTASNQSSFKLLKKFTNKKSEEVLVEFNTSKETGLSSSEFAIRFEKFGSNEIAQEKRLTWIVMLFSNFKNPFIIILLLLGSVSYLTDDIKATVVVFTMVVISVFMRFIQEFRSSKAAESLKKMVTTTATVLRDGFFSETTFKKIVVGDIIRISAGDMIPADSYLLSSKDLFISESALTGESMPAEKLELEALSSPGDLKANSPLECKHLCFMGTNVVSGTGLAVVIATGKNTFFGSLARTIVNQRTLTSFDKGVNSVTFLLINFMMVMVPIIFLLNGFMKGDWKEAFLFAVAVAVGLTPEMLPMVVTANLAKGAMALSKMKVIVKKLNAIQNFGAMDILCTDKTGTLTQDKVVLVEHLDTQGQENDTVLKYAQLNSYYQTGLKNLIDRAVIEHADREKKNSDRLNYQKIDEIPFDFLRKRMSVVVAKNNELGKDILICKGATEEIFKVCTRVWNGTYAIEFDADTKSRLIKFCERSNSKGLRVIAVATREISPPRRPYKVEDESNLILHGFISFLDPPKETAAAAIRALNDCGVEVKILTGDNAIVTQRVCQDVGLSVKGIILGDQIANLGPSELQEAAIRNTIFAKLSPFDKARIVKCLQDKNHTVGFLGDGINDAPALKQADVGISVDSATDIAKESADIILLEKSLLILEQGVIKGREVYGNIIKYIKMTASSNFGNVFSVLVASAFIPFLPMLPVHLLIQNLLYDFSQLALPWDTMDKEFLSQPRKWEPRGIARFMLFIGPISSVFDIVTFIIMWNVFKANSVQNQALFQSGWFVVGLLTQTLIVHMIRTQKIPFIQSRTSTPVLVSTFVIMAIGISVPFTRFGHAVGLVSLPLTYFPWLFGILFCYCVLTQMIKNWYLRRFKVWL